MNNVIEILLCLATIALNGAPGLAEEPGTKPAISTDRSSQPPLPRPPITELRGAEWSAERVAVSPDGKLALSGELNDGLIRLWDLSNGKMIRSMKRGRNSEIVCLEFLPDGSRALSSDGVNGVILWDLDRGSIIRTLPHRGTVWNVAFSPDGKRAVTGSGTTRDEKVHNPIFGGFSIKTIVVDPLVREWDLESGKELKQWPDNDGVVRSVAYSPDGTLVLSGGDHSCILRDLATSKTVRRFHAGPRFCQISHVAFGAKGSRVLAAAQAVVYVFDTESGRLVSTFDDLKSSIIETLQVLPDDAHAVSVSSGGDIAVWAIETGKQVHMLKGTAAGGSSKKSAALFPDGSRVLWSAHQDPVLHITALSMPEKK